jgi:hypothetical protein
LETWIVKGDAGFETESLFKKHIGDTFLEPASPVVRETRLVNPRLLFVIEDMGSLHVSYECVFFVGFLHSELYSLPYFDFFHCLHMGR